MRAGNLDKIINLKRKTTAENSFGELIETWTTFATIWAEKRELRGLERYAAQQVSASIDSFFRIRYRTDITVENILVCEGREYDITAVLEIGRREGLELYASARAE